MVDSILRNLYKFLNKHYLESDLLKSFNDIFWNRYGITKPEEQALVETFKIKIPDFNPINNESYNIEIEYDFNVFVIEQIRKYFYKLNQNYYDELKLIETEVKKSTFFNHICKELDIMNSLIKKENHLNEFQDDFTVGIKHFKNKFSTYSIQKITRIESIKNGFLLKEEKFQSQKDRTIAIYRLSKMVYLLRKYGFIDKVVSTETLAQVFNDKPIKEVIEWQSCLSSFCYFIKKLNNSELIDNHIPYIWGIADKCFTVRDKYGVPHNVNKFRWQKPPSLQKQKQLDEVLKY